VLAGLALLCQAISQLIDRLALALLGLTGSRRASAVSQATATRVAPYYEQRFFA
jgi:hypothetical protein